MIKKIELPQLVCKRCGHKWIPRKAKLPDVCPKCKSRYWNKERKKQLITTIKSIKEFIKKYEKDIECNGCHTTLDKIKYFVKHEPHDGGIEIKGNGKQWVWVHCRKCGYDTSIWKILFRLKRKGIKLYDKNDRA